MHMLVLLGVAAGAAAVLFRKTFAQALPVTVLAAVLLTYLCTGAGHKSLMLWLMPLAALGLLAGAVWQVRRTGLCCQALASPALAAALLALAAAFIVSGHMRLINYDDVAHWALYTRQQCGLEGFPSIVQSASAFADYPPGIQMLPVLLQLGGEFSQRVLYMGQFLWLTALALPLLGGLAWGGRWWKNAAKVLAGGFVLLAFCAWFTKYHICTLAPEPVMALLLGYSLLTAWQSPRPGLFELAAVSMALSVLMISKSTGPMYAAFGYIGALILWAPAAKQLGSRLRRWAAVLAGAAAPAAFWASWKVICALKHTSSYFTQDAPAAYSAQNLREFFQFGPRVRQVVGHFLQMLCLEPLNQWRLGLSALGLLAVVWLLAALAGRAWPQRKKTVRGLTAVLTLCFAAYAVMLCFSYLYLFEDWEADELSAFHRYVMPLLLALVYWLAGALLPGLRGLWQGGRKALRGCLLALAALAVCTLGWNTMHRLTPEGYVAQLSANQQNWYGEYGRYQAECAAAAAQLDGAGDKVLILMAEPAWAHSARLYKYFFAPAQTVSVNPVEYAEIGPLVQKMITDQGYHYIWCAPDGASTAEAWAITDQAGAVLRGGQLYRVQIESGSGQAVFVPLQQGE